jgi:hypothetical protein
MGERDWMRSLDEVDEAIGNCLAALERYEAKFVELLREQAVAPGPRFERSLPDASPDVGWADRLAAAKAGADEVEQLLAEQEAVWRRWRESLAAWRQLVSQQGVGESG